MEQAEANRESSSSRSSVRGWSSHPSSASSFAGMLASLTSPDPSPATGWNADDLADDVATLSYENALRAHARYKPGIKDDWDLAPSVETQTCRTCGARRSDPADSAQAKARSADLNNPAGNFSHAHFTINRSDRKCASITIRMSEGECEQLKMRAAEAGLTISAYLRSCTFEADSLRAEVKKTLAEMRKPVRPEGHKEGAKARSPWFEWLWRLIPHYHLVSRVARG